MQFHSTRQNPGDQPVTLEDAVLRGLAPDGGLYMPDRLDPMPDSFFTELPELDFQELACRVAVHLLRNALPEEDLRAITRQAVSFEAPLVQVEPDVWSLELFHGPTLAFKDFGARFLAGLLGYFARRKNTQVTILVATSGDTGSAVAHGFYQTPGIRVVILYPSGKVSDLQEKQFTTLGGNITALEVDGTFDDCQRLVKQAFADPDLTRALFLASANSINIARLIPQSFYYFRAWAQLPDACRERVVFSVPSGNFGNLSAGLMARRLGLPVHHFVAATNVNDVFPVYLASGRFEARPSLSTMSNAMDVGNPSNFERLKEWFSGEASAMRQMLTGYSFTDDETAAVMREVWQRSGYRMDPHGAVGYLGLRSYRREHPGPISRIFLETAHPAKFLESVDEVLGCRQELPEALQRLKHLHKQSVPMPADFKTLKTWLADRYF